jgi:hypothetical protein
MNFYRDIIGYRESLGFLGQILRPPQRKLLNKTTVLVLQNFSFNRRKNSELFVGVKLKFLTVLRSFSYMVISKD